MTKTYTLALLGLLVFANPALCQVIQHKPIYADRAIRAILGEARGEGYAGMYAVACAIRNRGTLQGVYGERAEMPDLTPELYQAAAKAWYTSQDGPDTTYGATHWENVSAFGLPYWARNATITARIRHHVFFKL